MSFLDAVGPAGTRLGTNSFRLMPDHEFAAAPASATITTAARGSLVTIGYGWTHPDDGAQEGALVLADAGPDRVSGLWIDTWHQQQAQPLNEVAATDSRVVFEFEYGDGWCWQIAVTVADALTVTMRNFVPADPGSGRDAIAYDVMRTRLPG